MKNKLFNLLIILLVLLISACEVEEGEGGTAKISGTLMIYEFNDDYSLLINKKAAQDEDIFIQYGNSLAVSDKVSTSSTGYFEFPYLFKGNYKVFYYTKDSTNSTNNETTQAVFNVKLDKGKEHDLGELIQVETLEWDEGLSCIKGTIHQINYSNGSVWPYLYPIDTTFAQEQEVYITYQDHEYYDDRIRTQEDGSFYFQNLIPGDYKIVVYSEDRKGSKQNEAIINNISIQENKKQTIDLGTIYIHNL